MEFMLRHRCHVYKPRIQNTDGVETKLWAIKERDLPCLLQEKDGLIRKDRFGESVAVDGVLYIAAGTDLKPRKDGDIQDRIEIILPENGGFFLVEFVSDESGLADMPGLACLKVTVKRTRVEIMPL